MESLVNTFGGAVTHLENTFETLEFPKIKKRILKYIKDNPEDTITGELIAAGTALALANMIGTSEARVVVHRKKEKILDERYKITREKIKKRNETSHGALQHIQDNLL